MYKKSNGSLGQGHDDRMLASTHANEIPLSISSQQLYVGSSSSLKQVWALGSRLDELDRASRMRVNFLRSAPVALRKANPPGGRRGEPVTNWSSAVIWSGESVRTYAQKSCTVGWNDV